MAYSYQGIIKSNKFSILDNSEDDHSTNNPFSRRSETKYAPPPTLKEPSSERKSRVFFKEPVSCNNDTNPFQRDQHQPNDDNNEPFQIKTRRSKSRLPNNTDDFQQENNPFGNRKNHKKYDDTYSKSEEYITELSIPKKPAVPDIKSSVEFPSIIKKVYSNIIVKDHNDEQQNFATLAKTWNIKNEEIEINARIEKRKQAEKINNLQIQQRIERSRYTCYAIPKKNNTPKKVCIGYNIIDGSGNIIKLISSDEYNTEIKNMGDDEYCAHVYDDHSKGDEEIEYLESRFGEEDAFTDSDNSENMSCNDDEDDDNHSNHHEDNNNDNDEYWKRSEKSIYN